MKVLALTEGPDHVCFRYRIEAFAGALAARGWTLESLPLVPSTLHRSSQLREAAVADVVILQRKLLPLWQQRVLRRAARVLIYDFDDALFCRDSYARKGPSSWSRLAHFWATIYAADAVIAGNEYLREQASQYIAPECVHLLPTCVDPARYQLATHTLRDRPPRLVWIGQHSTLPCLDHAQHCLAAAARDVAGMSLTVICNKFPEMAGVQVVPRQWSAATEAAEIAACDVGISYLPDHPWSLGKCGLKVLQYMAAGLPVVANPVGMNSEMIEDGVNGFLADGPREWIRAIARLAHDPDLRTRMGRAGRDRVERRFNTALWAERFVELIEDQHARAVSTSASPPTATILAGTAELEP